MPPQFRVILVAFGVLPVDEARGFAVVKRFFAMHCAGIDPARHNNSYPLGALRCELLVDLAEYCRQNPTLSCRNTIKINAGPVELGVYDDCAGSALRILLFAGVRQHVGVEAHARLWKLIGQVPRRRRWRIFSAPPVRRPGSTTACLRKRGVARFPRWGRGFCRDGVPSTLRRHSEGSRLLRSRWSCLLAAHLEQCGLICADPDAQQRNRALRGRRADDRSLLLS